MFFDSDKVHKIVNNLLSNAFKFTSEGGTVNLILSTEEIEQRNYVRIEVSDTGIGISESDLPYIFNRFYQVGNQGDEKMGSGIGLHLVREYVNIHEGTDHREQPDGSRFYICSMVTYGLETGVGRYL